jgi:hypothetical protein
MTTISESIVKMIEDAVQWMSYAVDRVTHDPIWMAGAAGIVLFFVLLWVLKKRASD